jgi:hypothetical protein
LGGYPESAGLAEGVSSASTYEIHDLHAIAFADDDLWKSVTFDDLEVVLDGNSTGIDVELGQQRRDRHRLLDIEPVAVQCDNHGEPVR